MKFRTWLAAGALALAATVAALAGTSNNVFLWSTTPGSNTTADAGINWSEGQAPSTINDSARGMMAAVARWRTDLGNITTGGTANAQTLTTTTGLTALATGNTVIFKVGSGLSNTAAATLNVDGLGAKSVRQFTAGGEVALSGGELQAGNRYLATYDTALNGGSGAWIVLNPTPASGTGYASTSTTITGSGYVTGGGNLGANRTLSLGSMGAASRLMGSASSSSTITDITLGSGLSMSGSTLSSSTSVTAGTGIGVAGSTVSVTNPIVAHVNWSGTTVNRGFNVSSVTNGSAGNFVINLTSAINSNATVVMSGDVTSPICVLNGKTTTTITVRCVTTGGTQTNPGTGNMVAY